MGFLTESPFFMSDYESTLAFLYNQLPFFQRDGQKAYKPGLNTIRSLCSLLDNPQDKYPTIHIGGTNGKGSTSHMTAAILQSAGYRVGLYTSPHLKSFTERAKVNGDEMSKEFVVSFVEKYKGMMLDFRPSFFEWTLLMTFSYFAEQKVDIAIIEVGLGGRFDSTNIIHPLVSLITNIGLDHTDILGHTKAEIAFQKAGIFKPNTTALVVDVLPETRNVFEEVGKSQEANVVFLKDTIYIDNNWRVNIHFNMVEFMLNDSFRDKKFTLNCGLVGEYQRDNLIGVYGLFQFLNESTRFKIPEVSFKKGLEEVTKLTKLKGRWQCLGENPLIIADTGHNSHAFEEHNLFFSKWNERHLHFVLGFMRDKDADSIIKLLPSKSHFYFCEIPSNFRSCTKDELARLGERHGLNYDVFSDVNELLIHLQGSLGEDDFIFIGGSTFLVAELNSL